MTIHNKYRNSTPKSVNNSIPRKAKTPAPFAKQSPVKDEAKPIAYVFPISWLRARSEHGYKIYDPDSGYSTWVKYTLVKFNSDPETFTLLFPTKPGWTFRFSLETKNRDGSWSRTDETDVDFEAFDNHYKAYRRTQNANM